MPAHAERDLDETLAPRTAEGVGDDDGELDAEARRERATAGARPTRRRRAAAA